MNLRLLKSIVTFLEIVYKHKGKVDCIHSLCISVRQPCFYSVFFLLYVISEFMNSLRWHPVGVFAIESLFKVKWNSLLLLK